MPSGLDTIVNAAAKTTPAAPPGNEATGIKNKKDAVAQYMKAVGNEIAPPKAASPQPASNKDKLHPNSKFGSQPGETRIDTDAMTKPLGSYKKGTPYVPKTGNYKLHEGEAVTPAKDNMSNAAMFDMVPGKKSSEKAPKKEIKRIEITKSHDGKHIIKHVHHHPAHEDETHVASNMAELHDHMEDHAGTPNEGEAPADGAAPAQLTASPSPVPAGPAGPPAMPGA